jgi:peptide-methionine (R)-S-oxide reductase
MRTWFLALLALSTSVACGQTSPGDKAADRQSTSSAPKADSGSEAAKREAVVKSDKVVRTEKEWRKLLTREQFRVLRMKGTERPFSNKYDRHFEPGTYACAACGQELFSSETKFDSGCGWPAFYAAKAGDRVNLATDLSQGMTRTEVTCARCGSHLGHIFDDAPRTPTGQRFCINSVSLKFIPAESKDKRQDEETPDDTKRNKEDEREKSSGAP